MFNDQDPEHLVGIDDFEMGETEVSNAHYVIFLNDMASLGNLMVEEGVPGDWASTPEEIANGHAWSIMADSTLEGEWSGEVLIKLSNIAGGGQDSLNRCWIEWDSTSYDFSVVSDYENWPASWVSWYGALMYADYYGVSLPTEAEWEYAARAGQQLEYPTNDGNLSYSQANYGSFGPTNDPDYLPYPSPVGELFQPNPFGLYNMAGNVSEWCLDWYDADFYQACVDSNYYWNPINDNIPEGIEVKVLRGGNYTYPGAFAMSSHRFDTPPFVTTDHMGFRVVTRSGSVDIGVEYLFGWNLVGLPLEVENNNYFSIFPDATESTLFSFDEAYVLDSTLVQGEGYWLRFDTSGITTITGTPMDELIIYLSEGWNLVSGLHEDLSIYSINDPGAIIVPNTFFGFYDAYFPTEVMVPGVGYWLRAFQDGGITLTSDITARIVSQDHSLKGKANTLRINGMELYFGLELSDRERLSYSLPPKPPSGAFDVRFKGDTRVTKEKVEIEVMSPYQSLIISYDVVLYAGEHMNWVLTAENGKDYILESSGEITVPSAGRFTLELEAVVPASFTLHQNFPNPFNPVTTLTYGLPNENHVTLTIYDLNGREINQIINIDQSAGHHSVLWNSTDRIGVPVSAGIYFYQIRAGEFLQTKKMVLLK